MRLAMAQLASAANARDQVEAVLCGDSIFEALVAVANHQPPAGFTATAEGKVWTISDQAALAPLDEEHGWPLLVAVGDTEAGRCHLNLGALRLLSIGGPEGQSLAARIVSQLAERGASGDIELVVVGASANNEQVTVGGCAQALDAIQGSGEDGSPVVMVSLATPSADELARVVASLDQPGGLQAAVILGDGGPRGWPVRAEADEVVLERLGLVLSPLPDDPRSSMSAAAGAPAQDPPKPSRPSASFAIDAEGPRVRVLGSVSVEGAAEPVTGKALELVAYLACHPAGVGDDRLQTALWPERVPARGTFNNLMSLARRQLGTDAQGEPYLPHATERRYRLAALVGCDLHRFEALADEAGKLSGGEARKLLVSALGMVVGRPFDEVLGYEWAHRDGLVAAAERRIVSTAHRLAKDALAVGELELAEWAACQGLRAAPGDEVLFRDRMLAAHAAGNTTAVESVMDELRAHLDGEDPLDALHPDTVELHHRLGQRPLARR